MTLSVCMICKNESQHIAQAIESIMPIADQIIVVDTGSTDTTLDILTHYPIELIQHPWQSDFAEARNISLAHATCDWVLILDADELLDRQNAQTVKQLLVTSPQYEGFFCTLTNVINGKHSASAVVFRLFKRNPHYQFVGKVHEQIIPTILAHHPLEALMEPRFEILHYGYDPALYDEQTKSKRNLDLLLNLDTSNKDSYYYYTLGNEWIRLGQPQDALTCYKQALTISDLSKIHSIYFPYLIFNLIRVLYFNNQPTEALSYFEHYILYFTDFKDLYLLGTVSALKLEKYDLANQYLTQYHSVLPVHRFYPSMPLEQLFDIPTIQETIRRGIFIVQNPISPIRLPLTIAILLTTPTNHLKTCLASIRKLNCAKILFTTYPLTDDADLMSTYGITIIQIPKLQNPLDFQTQLLKVLFPTQKNRNDWLLLLNATEGMSYVSLLTLQSLLESSPPYHTFTVEIDNGTQIYQDIRLIKISHLSSIDSATVCHAAIHIRTI